MNSTTSVDAAAVIDELQTSHEIHIQNLKNLHESELKTLHETIQKLRQESEKSRQEKEKFGMKVEELTEEVENLRESFDLIKIRLGKVLVEQDDLVEILKLFDAGECGDYEKSSSEDAAMKYFKKLESSDPIQLCRILEIPFCPDRAFSLSNSLLKSISLHLTVHLESIFPHNSIYPLLLTEISRLRQEINELCAAILMGKNAERIVKEISGKMDGTISKFLIENKKVENESADSSILKIFLSNFI